MYKQSLFQVTKNKMMQSVKEEKKESQKQHNFPNRKRSKIYKNLVTFFFVFSQCTCSARA